MIIRGSVNKLKILLITILLSGCSIIPPKEYIGIWKGRETTLIISETGRLVYSTKYGNTASHVQKITSNEISGLLIYLSIDGPPQWKKSGKSGKFLIVEGHKLYWTALKKPKPAKPNGLSKILSNKLCREFDLISLDCD